MTALERIAKEKKKKTGKLDLSLGNLKAVPDKITELTWLEELYLRSNEISDFRFLKGLTNLQSLDLSGNKISDIIFLKGLTNLQSLDLSYNKISDIRFLKGLTNLQNLDLRENQISDIRFLKGLTNLQSLDLRENQISDIRFLKGLTNLQSLDLSYNKISDITPLRHLIIEKGLDISLGESITGIRVGNNPLTAPPPEIVKRGREAVVNWFKQMKEGEAPFYESKLMILGQGGAGKTTLAELLLDEKYEVKKGKIDSTLGVIIHKGKEFKHVNIKDRNIVAHLWDFGGQDIQKMLHQFFITENCLYVLVSDKRSDSAKFDYWFQIINLLGPKSSVIVLENPIDIDSTTEDFPINKYRELYKDLDIESIEVNLKNISGSDKTKWKLFIELIESKLSKLEIVNRPVPLKWSLIRDEFVKLDEKKYISKDAYYDICAMPEIKLTHEDGDLCLYYLRSLGDLEYFDDRELCTNIFIDHNWLTEGLYYILSDKSIKTNKGRFTLREAYTQWDKNGYTEKEKAMLLQLLLKDKFDICYELKSEKDVYITPLLLPDDKPGKWEYHPRVHFRYRYNFMPYGMFSRLIVRLHEKMDNDQKWKSGVRLYENIDGEEVRAEVQQFTDPQSNQIVIDIKLNGEPNACKRLLSHIRNEIEDLHEDFKNISFKRIVGCNCEKCLSHIEQGENPSWYNFDKLLSKIANRKYTEECPNANFKEINIGQILSDVVIENVARDSMENIFFAQLKNMGMSINQIKNENIMQMSDFGKASSSSTSSSTAKAIAKSKVSINIANILGETENLKEDIERELKIKKIPKDEIDLAKSDVKVFENAIREVEKADKENKALPSRSKSRLTRFWEDVQDENSNIHKALKLIRKGKDYGVKLARLYNNIPGVPSIPPLALDVIDKL